MYQVYAEGYSSWYQNSTEGYSFRHQLTIFVAKFEVKSY